MDVVGVSGDFDNGGGEIDAGKCNDVTGPDAIAASAVISVWRQRGRGM